MRKILSASMIAGAALLVTACGGTPAVNNTTSNDLSLDATYNDMGMDTNMSMDTNMTGNSSSMSNSTSSNSTSSSNSMGNSSSNSMSNGM